MEAAGRRGKSYERPRRHVDDARGKTRTVRLPFAGTPCVRRPYRARTDERIWLIRDHRKDLVETQKPLTEETKQQIARETEEAIADVIVEKTSRAVEEHGIGALIMSGGVSANTHIRSELTARLDAVGCKLLVCPPEFSTDNGLMIALSGYFQAIKENFSDPNTLTANGNLKLR
jgi:tRNA A37 threonylcarbamoyltransferase TsaD